MAGISREMGDALDALAEVIRKAEQKLAVTPGAEWFKAIPAESEDEPPTFLHFREVDGHKCFVRVRCDSSSGATVEVKPLSKLPVDQRLRCARRIPAFVNDVIVRREKLPGEIHDIAADIEQALTEL